MAINKYIHDIIEYINCHPAALPDNSYTMEPDIEWLQDSFKAETIRLLDQIPFKKPRDRKLLEDALRIKTIPIFEWEDGKVFTIPFGDVVGIFGVTDTDENCKLLVCVYAITKVKNLKVVAELVISSFIKAVVPDADANELLDELKQFPQSGIVRGEVRLSFLSKGDSIWITAAHANVPV